MRRMPELSALDNAKSIIRVLPPKNTAGLARRSVSSIKREPRPPARTYAIASLARREFELLFCIFVSVVGSKKRRTVFWILLKIEL